VLDSSPPRRSFLYKQNKQDKKKKLDTAPASDRIAGERSATTPDAEDFGQRPLTSSIVTLLLPGHDFGRSMATH
jgi:hypothetical protein